LINQRQGSGSQLRNLRLRWDSSSKQIISFRLLTSSFSATTSHSISAFLDLTTAYDDSSLSVLLTALQPDTYYSSPNYPHQPRHIAHIQQSHQQDREERHIKSQRTLSTSKLGRNSKDTHHNGHTQHQIRQPRRLLRFTSRATTRLYRIMGLRFRRTLEGRLDR